MLFFLVFPLLLFSHKTRAQGPWDFKEELKKVSLEELSAHPGKYNSTERTDIFFWKANKHMGGNPDSALLIFWQMVDFGKKHGDDYVTSSGYSAISEMNRIWGKYETSKYYDLKGLPYTEKFPVLRSDCLLSLANNYIMTGQLDSAETVINECIEHTHEKCDTALFANPHLILGQIYAHREKYNSALDEYFQALKFAEGHSIPMKKANVFRNIALAYQYINETDKAIEYIKKALEITEKNNYQRSSSEYHALLGAYYREIGEHKKSLSHLNRALPYEEKKISPKSLSRLYASLAMTHFQLNEIKQASSYIHKAEKLIPEVPNDRDKSLFYMASGYIKLAEKNYPASKSFFQKNIETGRKASTPKRMVEGYEGLLKLYKKQQSWKMAYLYADSINLATKEMDLSNQTRLVQDLESRYKNKLKQEEIKRLKGEKKIQGMEIKKKNQLIGFTVLCLLLSMFAILAFYFANKTKQKSNRALKQKNAELSAALSTNKMLIKEIHHRVKNNLQVVSSLLNLQSRFEKDEHILQAINIGKNRVQTMSLLHQNLYVNENLKSISVKKYFTELAQGLTRGYPIEGEEINLTTDIDNIQLDIDQVVPLGLIINELITNSLKYAYVNSKKNCELLLMLKQVGNKIELKVADNGVGLPFNEIPARSKSMGMQLVHSFSKKLKATVDINNMNGTEFSLKFNI